MYSFIIVVVVVVVAAAAVEQVVGGGGGDSSSSNVIDGSLSNSGYINTSNVEAVFIYLPVRPYRV